jgi:hypothetical protein
MCEKHSLLSPTLKYKNKGHQEQIVSSSTTSWLLYSIARLSSFIKTRQEKAEIPLLTALLFKLFVFIV